MVVKHFVQSIKAVPRDWDFMQLPARFRETKPGFHRSWLARLWRCNWQYGPDSMRRHLHGGGGPLRVLYMHSRSYGTLLPSVFTYRRIPHQ